MPETPMKKLYSQFEANFTKYALAAVLLAIPLYPKFPFIFVPGTYVAIRLEDFLIAAILLFWIVTQVVHRKLKLPGGVIGKGILLYFAVGLLSTLSAIFVTHTVVPHIGLLHFLRRIEYMALFFVAASYLKEEKGIKFYIEAILWVIVCVLLYGLGQMYLNYPVISTQNEEFSKGVALHLTPGARLSSTFAGHYDLSAYLVIVMPLLVCMWTTKTEKWLRFAGLLGFVGGFWLLMMSASRISFPAYLVSITVTLILIKQKRWILPIGLVSVLLMATTTELASRYLRTADVYLSQLSKIIQSPRKSPVEPPYQLAISPTPEPEEIITLPITNTTPLVKVTPIPTPTKRIKRKPKSTPTPYIPPVIIEERSTEIRLQASWPRAIRAFKKNPILGTGYSSITLATDNDYLRLIGETGVLGTAAFLLIFVAIFFKSIKLLKEPTNSEKRIFGMGIIGSIIGILLNASFIDVLEASKVAIPFWIWAGFLAALIEIKRTTHEKNI